MMNKIRGFFCALFGGVIPNGILRMISGSVSIAVSAVLFLSVCLQSTMVVKAEEFTEQLYATAAVLMDADSGRVLYGKNADTRMAMASTTKIMTCITVLEYGNVEDMAEVSAYAASMPKVKLYVRCGETYKVRDLLYSLMLESHNDSAVVLAEYIGRQFLEGELRDKKVSEYTAEESKQAVAAFAKLMNEKAVALGCENTYFITPNGLDATETATTPAGEVVQKEHCTTATELARIMAYCIGESVQKELFLEITRTGSHSFSSGGRSFNCNNHNAFLSMMSGALSGKTGFTNKAGYCYVGALEREGRTFVVALLACGWPNNKNYKWTDTRKLMEYGLAEYFYRDFTAEEIAYDVGKLSALQVHNGRSDRLGETPLCSLQIDEPVGRDGLLMQEAEEVRVECRVKKELSAPVSPGEVVGNIYYIVDDTVYRQEAIITKDEILGIDFEWCLEQVLKRFQIGA